jgi:hypothetical protein
LKSSPRGIGSARSCGRSRPVPPKHVGALAVTGLVWRASGNVPHTVRAGLTDAGVLQVLSDDYVAPLDAEKLRARKAEERHAALSLAVTNAWAANRPTSATAVTDTSTNKTSTCCARH